VGVGFPEFVWSSHVRIGVHVFCEYQIVVSQMFDGVDKFIATTFEQQRHEVFKGSGKKLKGINESQISDLKG